MTRTPNYISVYFTPFPKDNKRVCFQLKTFAISYLRTFTMITVWIYPISVSLKTLLDLWNQTTCKELVDEIGCRYFFDTICIYIYICVQFFLS